MTTTPLDAYLDPRGIDLRAISKMYCTGLYRGYRATWEILDGALYLISLLDADNQPFDAEALFDGRPLPIRADWFSGRLDIDRGDLLDSCGAWGLYARRLFLYVEQGRVHKQRNRHRIGPLRRRYACTFDEYAAWRRERGALGPVGGLTAAGFAALGWPALEGEAPWPAADAEDDLHDLFEWLLPRCHRPGAGAATAP